MRVCPAEAIAETPAGFDHRRCFEQLKVFKNSLNLGHYICGVCVKACRGGKNGDQQSVAGKQRDQERRFLSSLEPREAPQTEQV